MEIEKNINCKIVLVGDKAVGKSCCIRRFVEDKFFDNYKPTLGFEISVKMLPIGEKFIVFSIWDVAGQTLFTQIRKSYYEGSRGFLLLFDLTNRATFDHLDTWVQEIRGVCPTAPIFLVGNKSDLPGRAVSMDEMTSKCEELGVVKSFTTSAKTGDGVLESFIQLGMQILNEE